MTVEEIEAIVGGYHGDAFRILGPHSIRRKGGQARWEIRAFLPQAESAEVVVGAERTVMIKQHARGFFVAAQDGFTDKTIYQITAIGLKHPQRHHDARLAHAPRLPVESDRVRAVLSAIRDARSLRIRDLKIALKIPHPSINALMQYLKRKALVQKTSQEQAAPYSLTEKGFDALTEMARRHAA